MIHALTYHIELFGYTTPLKEKQKELRESCQGSCFSEWPNSETWVLGLELCCKRSWRMCENQKYGTRLNMCVGSFFMGLGISSKKPFSCRSKERVWERASETSHGIKIKSRLDMKGWAKKKWFKIKSIWCSFKSLEFSSQDSCWVAHNHCCSSSRRFDCLFWP